jgi:hypothetical protein
MPTVFTMVAGQIDTALAARCVGMHFANWIASFTSFLQHALRILGGNP